MQKGIKTFETENFIIKIDYSDCISCGTCAALAPKAFEMNSDLAPIIKNDSKESLEKLKQAVGSCAPEAITIIDKKTGKKI